MYYVGFSTATIVASIILFQGLNTDDPANSLSLLAGFITTFLGVHLLELSRTPSGSGGNTPGENGYLPADEEIGLQTVYEPEPDDFEHVTDAERVPLHPGSRASDERERERT